MLPLHVCMAAQSVSITHSTQRLLDLSQTCPPLQSSELVQTSMVTQWPSSHVSGLLQLELSTQSAHRWRLWSQSCPLAAHCLSDMQAADVTGGRASSSIRRTVPPSTANCSGALVDPEQPRGRRSPKARTAIEVDWK